MGALPICFTLKNLSDVENLGTVKGTTVHCFLRDEPLLVELNKQQCDTATGGTWKVMQEASVFKVLESGPTSEGTVALTMVSPSLYRFTYNPNQPKAGSASKFKLRLRLSNGQDPDKEVTHAHPFCMWKNSPIPQKYLPAPTATAAVSPTRGNGTSTPKKKVTASSPKKSNSASTVPSYQNLVTASSQPGNTSAISMGRQSNCSSSSAGLPVSQHNSQTVLKSLKQHMNDISHNISAIINDVESIVVSHPPAHLIPARLPTRLNMLSSGTMVNHRLERQKQRMQRPRREKNPKIVALRKESNSLAFVPIDLGQGMQSSLLDNALIRLLGDNVDKLVLLRLDLSDDEIVKQERVLVNQLANGFTIEGDSETKYVFLNASNSGIKSGTCYCIKKELWEETFQRLGTFEEAKKSGISKLQSRIGMVASTSIASIDLKEGELADIDDIKSENRVENYEYELTDGAGVVTFGMAMRMAESISLDEVPSAFQIRVAGYKGVVAVYPDDSDVVISFRHKVGKPNAHLFLRGSMKKFESDNRNISILNYSQRMRGNLNRQLLTVLHELSPLVDKTTGETRVEEFTRSKLRSYVNRLLLSFEDYTIAREMIVEHSDMDEETGQERVLGSQIDMIDRLLHAKVSLNDPLLSSFIHNEVLRKLHAIIKGSKFKIPGSIGDFLVGIPDETKTLKEGQVVVCISANASDECYYFEGKVAVTRYPLNHGGGIRMLEAVKPPLGLSHLRNVIVFPVTTDRPVQDMMGGGDLDGDMYLVISDGNLHFEENKTPLNYKAIAEDDEIVQKDHTNKDLDLGKIDNDKMRESLARAFVTNKDIIGLTDWHIRLAAEEGGIDSDNYEYLAKVYAVALDGIKSGQRIREMQRDLKNSLNATGRKFVWTRQQTKTLFEKMFSEREKFLQDILQVRHELQTSPEQHFNEKTGRRRLFNVILWDVLGAMESVLERAIPNDAIDPDLNIENLLSDNPGQMDLFKQECEVAKDRLAEWGKDWRKFLSKKQDAKQPNRHKNAKVYHLHRMAVQSRIRDRADIHTSEYDYDEVESVNTQMFLKYREEFETDILEDEHKLQIRASAWHVVCEKQFQDRKGLTDDQWTNRFSRMSSVALDKLCDLKVRQIHKRARDARVQDRPGRYAPTFSPIILA